MLEGNGINELPAQGGEVLAFSDDWGIRSLGMLDQETYWSTGDFGNLSFTFPWEIGVFNKGLRSKSAHNCAHCSSLGVLCHATERD